MTLAMNQILTSMELVWINKRRALEDQMPSYVLMFKGQRVERICED